MAALEGAVRWAWILARTGLVGDHRVGGGIRVMGREAIPGFGRRAFLIPGVPARSVEDSDRRPLPIEGWPHPQPVEELGDCCTVGGQG